MATIEIRSWGDFVGGTAWDPHPESELKKRIRRGVNASQHQLRTLARRIRARETLAMHNVRDEAVLGIVQILRTMGAETFVDMDDLSDAFKRWPKR